jgi:hypothetical protein
MPIFQPEPDLQLLAIAFVFERDFGLYCARFENGPKICKSSAEETINELMTQNTISSISAAGGFVHSHKLQPPAEHCRRIRPEH